MMVKYMKPRKYALRPRIAEYEASLNFQIRSQKTNFENAKDLMSEKEPCKMH